MERVIMIVLRYAGAGLVAAACAVVAILVYDNCGGDEDDTPLSLIVTVGFIAVAAGAFCFPLRTRPFRSVVLFGLELLLYCSTKLDPNDDFLQSHPFPCLVPLVYGGLLAILFHFIIYLLYLALRRPGAASGPTAKIAGLMG